MKGINIFFQPSNILAPWLKYYLHNIITFQTSKRENPFVIDYQFFTQLCDSISSSRPSDL